MTNYTMIALDNTEYEFYHTTEKYAVGSFPEVRANQVVLLKDFDERIVIFKDKLVKENFIEFLNNNMIPTVSDVNQKAIEMIFKDKGKKGIFLFRALNSSELTEQDAEFTKVATKLKKQYIFLTGDVLGGWTKKLADYLGIEYAIQPLIEYIENTNETIRYRYTGPIKEAEIEKFIEDCKKGLIQRFLKSEPVPTENPGPVFKLVAKTFKDEVLNNDLDILVKFYAPWCGHCKKLEPVYKALAETLMKSNKKLKLYEIDATKNDIEGHPVEGFPVIKLFLGKDKSKFLTFEGDRTEEGIAKFLKEKCTNPIILTEKLVKAIEEKAKEKPKDKTDL